MLDAWPRSDMQITTEQKCAATTPLPRIRLDGRLPIEHGAARTKGQFGRTDTKIWLCMTDPGVIYAAQKWPTNAHMIADAKKLGYLYNHWLILDPTYGLGNFWKVWRPKWLITSDAFTNASLHADFTNLPFRECKFEAVVFDPPYKMNGTPSGTDKIYGVHVATRWQERIGLIRRGVKECARVVAAGGYLLVKCQDQVVSGKVVWQTDIVTEAAKSVEMTKVDRLDFLTDPRPQPHARQIHARRNYSTLLIFQK